MMVHVGVGVTPDAFLDAIFDPRNGQYVLKADARHRASRKGVALNDDRLFRQDCLNIECFELAAVEHATEIDEVAVRIAADTMTKIVLASGVKAQILLHLSSTRIQK